ncbi:neuronal acetylcholine receptor subunit alpha-6-like [Haliotis rubra]|uniref:neuronal acetylcholine receptor subunit alpha-6-like n=1 Tax=Haliotis rubra TaxID=36100 RepID=UPI001EE5C2A3|nr:neuronal acetylcholine receptor subunit alpha-6-like [Haliotis rubra]
MFLNTTSRLNKIDMSTFVPHGEFTTGESSVHFNPDSVAFTEDVLVTITYTLVLNRRPAFYWMVMVFPMASFPLLSPVSFLVPVESGEKITLSITVVLSYLVFIGSINDAMPRLSDTVSLIVIYATVQTMISMLTVVANGIIICIHKLPQDFHVTVPLFKTSRRPHSQRKKKHDAQNGEKLELCSITGKAMSKASRTINSSRKAKYELQNGESFKSNSPKLESSSVTGKSRALPLAEERMKENSETNGLKWVLLARRLDKICLVCFVFLAASVSVVFGLLFTC